jgi:hypothetical protein
MTLEECHEMERLVKAEWAVIRDDDEQLQLWRAARRNSITLPAVGQVVVRPDDVPFVSPCGLSENRNDLIPSSAITSASDANGGDAQARLAARAASHASKASQHVAPPVPNRMRDVDKPNLMVGCYTCHKNVCREHRLSSVRAAQLTGLVGYMKSWANSLTAVQQSGCCELVGFVGKHGTDGEDPIMVVELLVLTRLSPKMQFFADCHTAGAEGRAIPYPTVPPWKVVVGGRIPRLALEAVGDGALRASSISTSDELALDLLALRNNWSIVPLKYDLDTSSPSLVSMIITELSDEFVAPPPRARVFAARIDLPAEFELGDPMEYGRSIASSSAVQLTSAAPGAPAADHLGDGLGDHSSDDGAGEDTLIADVEPDVLDDMAELLEEGCGLPPMHEEAMLDADMEPEPLEVMTPAEALAVDEQVLADAEAGPPIEADAAPPILAAEECALVAEVDADGYIFCPLEAVCQYKPCGRITFFPAELPPERQSVSIRCRIHAQCSFTRTRRNVSNARLLRWLFTAKPWEPGEAGALHRHEHAIAAATML